MSQIWISSVEAAEIMGLASSWCAILSWDGEREIEMTSWVTGNSLYLEVE